MNDLENKLDDYVLRAYGSEFKFRRYQKETILDICKVFFEGKEKLYLLQAPVGSGKSIIAMVVSGFLSSLGKSGYILTSNLALQTQYEKDLVEYKLNFGSIKGVDNYTCSVNSEKFSLGECRSRNISYGAAQELDCFATCGYFSARRKAISSRVSLLNYSYFLIQRNYVGQMMEARGQEAIFAKRDFTICDEAHNLAEIVQGHFSPRIDKTMLPKLEKIIQVLTDNGLSIPANTSKDIKLCIDRIYSEECLSMSIDLLCELRDIMHEFVKRTNPVRVKVNNLFKKTDLIPHYWKHVLGLLDWTKDVHCKLDDYCKIIENSGVKTMIKNLQGEQVTFNCINESYLMNKHFHEQCNFKVMMTATMGTHRDFMNTIGAKSSHYRNMESTFNYSRSPIILYVKKKMDLKNRDATIPWAANEITKLINKHKQESGIIHSGSYIITNAILKLLPKEVSDRVLIYNGTQDKETKLARFLSEDNLVLVGPSLLEGLDLSDDKSRFQIFLKVPYPYIGDKLVKAKMENIKGWYNWKTIVMIQQGIGRSVRSVDDWCVTYLLDGCFADVLSRNRNAFTEEFTDRIQAVEEFEEV